MGISVTCNEIFYLLNRDSANRQRGLDFANEAESGLYPEPLKVHYIIEFDDRLPTVAKLMHPEEYQTIVDFQAGSERFQDNDEWQKLSALVAKTRQE